MVKGIHQLCLLLCIMLPCSPSLAQSFEGFIQFDWTKNKEKTTYQYFVKGDFVRAVEISADGKVKGVLLVNTKTGDQITMNPEKKLLSRVNNHAVAFIPAQVRSTDNPSWVHGYECRDFVATHEELGVFCEYTIAKGNFDFFIPMINTLKRKENLVLFYASIPDMKGGFPMIGEEKDSDGKLIMRLEVTHVVEATVDDALFSVPTDYEEFKR